MWMTNPDALVSDLEHELVVMHAPSGEMFSLSASGRAAWQALPSDLAGVSAALITLGAAPEQARHDAETWLAEMSAAGLILRRE